MLALPNKIRLYALGKSGFFALLIHRLSHHLDFGDHFPD
jgi:hypothetical protein